MADKIAELSRNGGEPRVDISITQPNDLPRGRYQIILYDSNKRNPMLIGDNDGHVDNPSGNHPFPLPLSQLDDCWVWFRASIGGSDDIPRRWFLKVKIVQDGQVVDGGNYIKEATFDSYDRIHDQVRLNVS
jgi:hypothetical protein